MSSCQTEEGLSGWGWAGGGEDEGKESECCWGLEVWEDPGHPRAALRGASRALSRKAPCGTLLPDLQRPHSGGNGHQMPGQTAQEGQRAGLAEAPTCCPCSGPSASGS